MQLLVPIGDRGVAAGRSRPPRDRLHVRRELRLPHRRSVRVRVEPRSRRRVAADLGVARRDGRRVGAVRGVGAPAARRHRHRARVRLGQVVAVAAATRCGRSSSTRTTWRRSASIRCRSPACRRGRCSTRARRPNATSPKSSARSRRNAKDNPNAQVSGDVDVEALLDRAVRAGTVAHARLAADLRRRGRGRARPRRQGPGAVRSGPAWIRGLDHRIEVHQPGMRDLTSSPSTTLGGAQGRLRRRPDRRGRAVARRSARRS